MPISVFLFAAVLLLTACVTTAKNPTDKGINYSNHQSLEKKVLPLFCKLGVGSVRFASEWEEIRDVNFFVHQEGRVNVSILNKKRSKKEVLQVIFDNIGQKMVFCPVKNLESGKKVACNNIYALEGDLHDGIKRTLDIKYFIRDGEITCAYDKKNLKSLNPPF